MLPIRAFDRFIDHAPLVMCADFPLPKFEKFDPKQRFDHNALQEGLQTGNNRVAFLQKLEENLKHHSAHFKIFEKDFEPTRQATLFIEIAREAALAFYAVGNENKDWYKTEAAERKGLLAERAELKKKGCPISPDLERELAAISKTWQRPGSTRGHRQEQS